MAALKGQNRPLQQACTVSKLTETARANKRYPKNTLTVFGSSRLLADTKNCICLACLATAVAAVAVVAVVIY